MHCSSLSRSLSWILVTVALTAPFLARSAASQGSPQTGSPAIVLLVRHGEKGSGQGEDPRLTAAGAARAQALAEALRYAGVSAIITTQLRRTRETAQPLAMALGLKPEIVPVNTDWGDVDAHAKAVVAAIRRHPGGVVLVVGHQNTLAPIIAALGGPSLPDIADPIFSNLYMLIPEGGRVHLVEARYGAPDHAK